MIPQISAVNIQNIEIRAYPSFTYKLINNRIIGHTDGLEALQQAIFHRLSIERYAYPIYDDDYGVELEQYIGSSFEFFKANIGRTLRDALLQDDRIIEVQIDSITKTEIDSCRVEFTVISNMGNINQAVNVNV